MPKPLTEAKRKPAPCLAMPVAGALIAVLSPFVLTQLLAALANYQDNDAAAASFSTDMALSMAPLALM